MLWFGVGCAFIFVFYNVLSLLLQHVFRFRLIMTIGYKITRAEGGGAFI